MNIQPFFVTIVGAKYYDKSEYITVGEIVVLIKDYNNPYDDEAVEVYMPNVGKIGYIANSTRTVARGTRSAGRIYDTFGEYCLAKIMFVLQGSAIAEIVDLFPANNNSIVKITSVNE
ncbi:HIRAN domain-containing protein [Bacillus sp. SM2101]|uniref:HIRAN domain-containing protein n=1 Tax=Bacillus sp. SM2101 TaxID=2805366 RepID=UPI001BDE970E|nr:HIRAN domain-containing protein [Bacillus sp. SM2101]